MRPLYGEKGKTMFIAVVSIPNPKARAGEAFTHVWATLGAYPTPEQAQAAIDLYAAKNPVQESRISQTLPRFFFQGASPESMGILP